MRKGREREGEKQDETNDKPDFKQLNERLKETTLVKYARESEKETEEETD